MIYIYNENTGQIIQAVDCPSDHAKYYECAGKKVIVINRNIDIAKNYFCGEEIVPIPDKPSEFHVWDWTQLTWKQDAALAEKTVRNKRTMLLNNTVDKINAIRWAAMTEDERISWDEYRTSLLDITQQEGFPFNVIWPTAPQ